MVLAQIIVDKPSNPNQNGEMTNKPKEKGSLKPSKKKYWQD